MPDTLMQPWPWYVSGPLIALLLVALLFMGRSFGVSSTFRQMCSAAGCGKSIDFFDYDWKKQKWNLLFVLGALIGGWISQQFLIEDGYSIALSSATVSDLTKLGFIDQNGLMPERLFSVGALSKPINWIILVSGGFAIGFGARYAGGCTSGHAITGLSNLQLPSLVAVIGFFIGGLFMTHLLFPLIFN